MSRVLPVAILAITALPATAGPAAAQKPRTDANWRCQVVMRDAAGDAIAT
jgi:hypothetical protein